MLIRLLVGLSGPAFSLGPGDEREFPDDEALRLIAAGYAAPVADRAVETTTRTPAPERRDAPPPPPDWDNPRSASRRKRKGG
jgi:hypothetical protein